MRSDQQHIAIAGAGLVGSLMAIYLAKQGFKVTIYERRTDMRVKQLDHGRSINLALSSRGLRALAEVGLSEELRAVAIPMNGRMIHSREGQLTFQPYGKPGQFINSISRSNLNKVLMSKAESLGVKIVFEHRILKVDFEKTELTFEHQHRQKTESFDAIIGADGAFSAVRAAMQISDRFNYAQSYIDHGYLEFHIPPGENGSFQLEKNALHIWPRASFMLIALPNPDGSFTCTLFFPFDGKESFSALRASDKIENFLRENFADVLPRIENPITTWQQTPASSLVTIRCSPWSKNKTLLIGDAAHAIVPFFGQGMNAGFEDCRILNERISGGASWAEVFSSFAADRKPDADAIAQLALDNFIEMRDLVANEDFLLRKKIEAALHQRFPDRWIPAYSMVTFYDEMGYAEAQSIGLRQKKIMDEVMQIPNLKTTWEQLDFERIVDKLTNA